MIYDYAEPTGFFPTAATTRLAGPDDYVGYPNGTEAVTFPDHSAAVVVERCACVIDRTLSRVLALAER